MLCEVVSVLLTAACGLDLGYFLKEVRHWIPKILRCARSLRVSFFSLRRPPGEAQTARFFEWPPCGRGMVTENGTTLSLYEGVLPQNFCFWLGPWGVFVSSVMLYSPACQALEFWALKQTLILIQPDQNPTRLIPCLAATMSSTILPRS